MEVCYEHAGEREGGEGRGDKYSEATQYNSNFMLSPHSLSCNIPPDLMNTEKKPRGLQTCPSSQKMKGGVGSMIRTMRIMNQKKVRSTWSEKKGGGLEECMEGDDGQNPEVSNKDCLQFP